jgi:hypothetical protein
MSEEGTGYCHECKRPFTEIDNRGQLLRGCMMCNIWWSPEGAKVRLSEQEPTLASRDEAETRISVKKRESTPTKANATFIAR